MYDDLRASDFTERAVEITGIGPTGSDPVALLDGPVTTLVGLPVEVDGSRSYDPDGGSITNYRWDFGDGTVIDPGLSSGDGPSRIQTSCTASSVSPSSSVTVRVML